ncbi:heavy metal translocating P-type ATPase [Marinobacterium sp. YM272]|uniref:heavy metal translocating P-type ATPase n=1 Tax=Marinobacterium sp. YM272 TaxID=3421654 RepID=UPI003D7FF925
MSGNSSLSQATHSWHVSGMDCGSCVRKVQCAVERLPGVSDVNVSMINEMLTLSLDESQTTAADIEATVSRLGYTLSAKNGAEGASGASFCCSDSICQMTEQADTSDDNLTWQISGMDCGGCAAKIRGALEKLPGIEGINISMISETLSLRLNGAETSAQQIEATVSDLGFQLSQKRDTAHSDEQREQASSKRLSWFNSPAGRLITVTGVLLVIAWVVRFTAGEEVARWVFALACLVGLVPVAKRAFAALRSGMPFTIEMLMTIAAGGALIIGATAEAALVVFLFAIGEMLEGVAADRARAGIRALGKLLPKTARLETPDGIREIDAAQLEVDQIVLVRPGDRLPTDGEVIEGYSGVDESPVTGESVPVDKAQGDSVFAASINTDGTLRVRVTKPVSDNTISRIIRMVEEAESSRAPTERFIDRFSRYYMPVIVGLAVLVAVVPPLLFGQLWDTWIYRALTLLLIGCPCALVISVPASIASALYAGTRSGLLMKGGAVIESTAGIRHIAFDKTGTLTLGRPQITDIEPIGLDRSELLRLAAAVEAGSSHPLAVALVEKARSEGIQIPDATEGRAHPGRGMEAMIGAQLIRAGSPLFAREAGMLEPALEAAIQALEEEGKTVVTLFTEQRMLGVLALRDEPRPDAITAINNLKALGITPVMLTGDNPRTAAAIAQTLGIGFFAGLLPEDKVAAVRKLVAKGPTMMVGDGINDAPALASAHVGVAMGGGTDVAMETADGALLRNYVDDVTAKVRLARATMANIRQNLAIALGLKGLFLITTLLGITGLWLAVLADTGATVLVTLNALRLLGFRHN